LVTTDLVPISLLVSEVCSAAFTLKFSLPLPLDLLPVSPTAVVLLPALLLKLLLLIAIVGLVAACVSTVVNAVLLILLPGRLLSFAS
jgi:hypothetical protein